MNKHVLASDFIYFTADSLFESTLLGEFFYPKLMLTIKLTLMDLLVNHADYKTNKTNVNVMSWKQVPAECSLRNEEKRGGKNK
ncbi:hypothetical protein H4J59_12600 [Colwellia sp. MB02u-10]|uniref:hypothetical protein n=1 Tax=Colwellia sp. MB02u-10 TaxID=2759828 RepID=UPI0015F5D5A9|nr:hypothetical protein [Colwellia sp. MB02u-10]MBA6341826.1 hypothetical protein [Colwellia sp. MB02u-10]